MFKGTNNVPTENTSFFMSVNSFQHTHTSADQHISTDLWID